MFHSILSVAWLRKTDAGIPRTKAEAEVISHGFPEEEAQPLADRPGAGVTAAPQLGLPCPADLSLRCSAGPEKGWESLFFWKGWSGV